MHAQKNKYRRGFTLTELITVVIILGILTALASGSYKKAVERSRMSDGLVAATTVAEAVDRYYLEHVATEGDAAKQPPLRYLDISFPNQKRCADGTSEDCIETKYFFIALKPDQVVASRKTGDYDIIAFPSEFGGNQRVEPVCHFSNETGQDLCISSGYISCDEDSICRK